MEVYIASPFFNERQNEILEEVKKILDSLDISYFSPKDDCLFENGKGMDAEAVFNKNCLEIERCDCLLAITDGLDAGTLWESGFAYGIRGKEILYVWVDHVEGANFNLMLAQSATATVKGFEELKKALEYFKEHGDVEDVKYSGKME